MTLSPSTLIPAGTIIPYLGGAQTAPPDGWLFCDGSEQQRSTYGDLFSAIGTTYGSTGGSTFTLPGTMRVFKGDVAPAAGASNPNHTHSYSRTAIVNMNNETGHNHAFNAAYANATGNTHGHSAVGLGSTGANTANFLAVAGSANYLAAASHTHGAQGWLDAVYEAHSHSGNAGSINATTTHAHSFDSGQITYTSSPSSNPTYPPYMLIWHIIKY